MDSKSFKKLDDMTVTENPMQEASQSLATGAFGTKSHRVIEDRFQYWRCDQLR